MAKTEKAKTEKGGRVPAPEPVQLREEIHPAAPEGHRRMKAHMAPGQTLRLPHGDNDATEIEVSDDGYMNVPGHLVQKVLDLRLGSVAD